MSQISSIAGIAPVGTGILKVEPNAGDNPVFPDAAGLLKILGTGNIVVTGDDANNAVVISSTGLATQFTTNGTAPDDIAAPIGGNLYIVGINGQTVTNAPDFLGNHDVVTIGLDDNVNIPHSLYVGDGSGGGVGSGVFEGDVQIQGHLNVVQNLIAGTSVFAGSYIQATTILQCAGNLISTAGLCHTFAGFFTPNGNYTSNGGSIFLTNGSATFGWNLTVGAVVQFSALNIDGGIVQTSGTGVLSSSRGTDGQILISSSTGAPLWRPITTPDGSVVITPGANSIGLSSGTNIATTYPTDAGIATPAAKVLQIRGGANINTAAITGNTVRVSLNDSITLAAVGSFISAAGTITTTGGNVFAINGDMRSLNGFITLTGNIATTSGNIVTTTGTVSGAHLVATTDLRLPNVPAIPRVLLQNGTGLVVPTNGTNAQIVMATAAGTTWGNLAAGGGIGLDTSVAGTITINNTGVGGVKAAFSVGLNTSLTNVTGDGSTIIFSGAYLASNYDTLGSFNLATGTFTALADGIYQFMLQINGNFGGSNDYYNTLYVYTTSENFEYATDIKKQILSPESLQYVVNVQLFTTNTVRFGFKSQSVGFHKLVSIFSANTFFTGFQIS